MAENGYGTAPVAGHIGRIPNFGKTQVNPLGNIEPPACIQNAMMTKDKKPFTYTPGGLDLSQIRTPSMARRMARQRSLEEQEQGYPSQANGGGNYNPQGGPAPPPPPPQAPAPPPPPPLVISAPNSKSPKPITSGERPEIVIPENPIGMLRKTNSPYHWESEKAQMDRMGPVPKFVEKVPSPLTVKMPPSTFSQQPPQNYTPQAQNIIQRQNYPYSNQTNQIPESPVHRPEAQYAHQKSASPNSSGPTRELLQRQDSQFNKSPQPFGGQTPLSNGSPYSPAPNNNWKQPERRDSPANNNGPQSPQFQRGPFSPNTQQQYSPNYQNQSPSGNVGSVYCTLPRTAQRNQDNYSKSPQNNNYNNAIFNNTRENRPQSPRVDSSNPTPWRTNTLNRYPRESDQSNNYNNNNANQQQSYSPPWKSNEVNNNQPENSYIPYWKQEDRNLQKQQPQQPQQQQHNSSWASQDSNINRIQGNYNNRAQVSSPTRQNQSQEQPRYQSTMSIPVTPRKQNSQPEYNNSPSQKEVVYVNQEPVYFCPDSPKSMPAWVKTQKEKTKTPPPAWCQRPLEGRKSLPRDLVTPPREENQEPEWVRKSNEIQRNAREVISPPKYQQTAQPNWSTRPSENRKSVPRDNVPNTQGSRIIPVQMEVSSSDHSNQRGNQQPQLRIVIDMQNPNTQNQARAQAPLSQPTQRIMRVLSPQLVRLDDGPTQPDLPSLNKSFQSQDNQPKTRIIPIQIEGGSSSGANKRVYYHKFTQEGQPRQSNAFKVLQIITGTRDEDHILTMEDRNGFTDV